MKILVIDNYDSFTYNLVHFLGELGAQTEVVRNDKITVQHAINGDHNAILLSPGPKTPTEAGICLELVEAAKKLKPILGVCLGHQAIGQAFGANIVRAVAQMHGKVSTIHHTGRGVFHDLNADFTATRYHSLTVDKDSLPDCFEITATSDDGMIMGMMHKDYPLHGVQFHPESIASECGHQLLKNFLDIAAKN